jgi:lysophospholipase L1-like esterase
MADRVVLCFGDSNTWGASPVDISRFPYPTRWPGQLASILGEGWHVVEEGLPNRTTCFNDPAIPLRSGEEVLPMVLETHSPVDVFIVMLGTNDAKSRVGGVVGLAVAGMRRIAEQAAQSGANVLIVAPAPMVTPIKYDEFDEQIAIPYCCELATGLRRMAEESGFLFLDAAGVVRASPEDGVHLDEAAHFALARALGSIIQG